MRFWDMIGLWFWWFCWTLLVLRVFVWWDFQVSETCDGFYWLLWFWVKLAYLLRVGSLLFFGCFRYFGWLCICVVWIGAIQFCGFVFLGFALWFVLAFGCCWFDVCYDAYLVCFLVGVLAFGFWF